MTGSPQAFKAALTDVDPTAQVPLGMVRYEDNKVYKYVKFSGTTVIAAGDVVVLCGVGHDMCQTVDGANTALGAGSCACRCAIRGGCLWLDTDRGVATLSAALAGSPAVGDGMTTAGAAAPAVTKSAAANSMILCNVVHVANKIVALRAPN
jgi:hypothetical protein